MRSPCFAFSVGSPRPQSRTRPSIVAIGVVATLLGCSADDSATELAGPVWQSRDSAGIEVIETGLRAIGDVPDVELYAGVRRVTTIGGAADVPVPEQFGYVQQVLIVQDTLLAVLDGMQGVPIQLFHVDGHWLRTLGTVGEGPGELSGPIQMMAMGDSLVVLEASPTHLDIFPLDGGRARTSTTRDPVYLRHGPVSDVAEWPEVPVVFRRPSERRTGWYDQYSEFGFVDVRDGTLRSVEELLERREGSFRDGGFSVGFQAAYTLDSEPVAYDGGLAWLDPNDGVVQVWSRRGEKERVVRFTHERAPVTDADIERHESGWRRLAEQRDDDYSRWMEGVRRREMLFADSMPRVPILDRRPWGLWRTTADLPPTPDSAFYRYPVYDADFRHVAFGLSPREGSPFRGQVIGFDDERMILSGTTDMGIPYIDIWELPPPPDIPGWTPRSSRAR